MNEEQNDIENLITRYLTGEASADEQTQLLAWRAQRAENEKHFLDLQKTFNWSQEHYARQQSQHLGIDVDREWNQFVRTIGSNEGKSVRPLYETKTASRGWMRIAAAFLLVITAGWLVNYWINKNSELIFQTAGDTLNVALPDGSQVMLNQNSRLSYSKTFGEEKRTVHLEGEAFFEVTPDKQKPFIIQVSQAQIEVLGTSFNVQGYSNRKAVEVVVATGVVRLSVPGVKKEVKLAAGEKGLYSKQDQQLISKTNEDVNFIAWKTRHLIFEETDLRAVVETLNRTYGANIILATDVPASCVVTVTFDQQSLEAVLNVLKSTLNLTYRIQGDTIEIIQAGC